MFPMGKEIPEDMRSHMARCSGEGKPFGNPSPETCKDIEIPKFGGIPVFLVTTYPQ